MFSKFPLSTKIVQIITFALRFVTLTDLCNKPETFHQICNIICNVMIQIEITLKTSNLSDNRIDVNDLFIYLSIEFEIQLKKKFNIMSLVLTDRN